MSEMPPSNSFSVVQSKSDFGSMLRLAVPALAEEFLVLAVTWTDWWLTGHYFYADGDSTKTAMSMMGYVMWLTPSLFASVAIGATAVVARNVGAGNSPMASRAANQSLIIGGLMAIAMLVGALIFGDQFLMAMQLKDQALEFARQYFAIAVWSIPFIMLSIVGSACLRGAGDMISGFLVKSIVVGTNVLVSFGLVTGWSGLPEIGWEGLAIGTASGHTLGGMIILLVLIRGRAGLRLKLSLLKPVPAIIKQVLKIGLPGGFDVAVLLFSHMVYLSMINSMGVAAAAAHGLAVQMEAACYLPGAAFQAAAATMAGQFLGAGFPNRAFRSGGWCFLGGGIVMCCMAMLLYLFGREFGYFFTGQYNDPTVVQAANLLRIVAVVMPFLALGMILTGTLRGAGDTILPLLFTAFGFFVIRIPLAAYLGFSDLPWLNELGLPVQGLGWGVVGAWYAMVIDIVIRSLFALARYLQGGWQQIQIS